MINTTLRGKPRLEDVTGKLVGPYVVVGPVGSDWRTSIYWVLRCRLCGMRESACRQKWALTSRRKPLTRLPKRGHDCGK